MLELDISEVARKTKLPPSTLRYYESRGLIAASSRKGLRRQYSNKVLDQLALITLGRSAGFSLDEIKEFFLVGGKLQINRVKLAEKADELDKSVARLSAIRDGLRHAGDCPAPSHFECPTFQRLMKAANAGVLPQTPSLDRL